MNIEKKRELIKRAGILGTLGKGALVAGGLGAGLLGVGALAGNAKENTSFGKVNSTLDNVTGSPEKTTKLPFQLFGK